MKYCRKYELKLAGSLKDICVAVFFKQSRLDKLIMHQGWLLLTCGEVILHVFCAVLQFIKCSDVKDDEDLHPLINHFIIRRTLK